MSLIQALPEVTGQLMKPAERIESIRVLDLGGNGGGNGASGGGVGKILRSILGAGAAVPVLKEILNFADVEPQKLVKTVSDLVHGLDLTAETKSPETTGTEAS